jgi:hypothetical protein
VTYAFVSENVPNMKESSPVPPPPRKSLCNYFQAKPLAFSKNVLVREEVVPS